LVRMSGRGKSKPWSACAKTFCEAKDWEGHAKKETRKGRKESYFFTAG